MFKLLKAAFEASTQAVWNWHLADGVTPPYVSLESENAEGEITIHFTGGTQEESNVEFFALAHNAMPQLLKAIPLLAEANKSMLEGYRKTGDWATETSAVLTELGAGPFTPPMKVLYSRDDGQVFGVYKSDEPVWRSIVPIDLADAGEGYEHSSYEDAEHYLFELIHKVIDVDKRFNEAVENAQMAFWAEIAKAFPEIKSGDLSPHTDIQFTRNVEQVTAIWLRSNCEEAQARFLVHSDFLEKS